MYCLKCQRVTETENIATESRIRNLSMSRFFHNLRFVDWCWRRQASRSSCDLIV